jgi:hypothetical protein
MILGAGGVDPAVYIERAAEACRLFELIDELCSCAPIAGLGGPSTSSSPTLQPIAVGRREERAVALRSNLEVVVEEAADEVTCARDELVAGCVGDERGKWLAGRALGAPEHVAGQRPDTPAARARLRRVRETEPPARAGRECRASTLSFAGRATADRARRERGRDTESF